MNTFWGVAAVSIILIAVAGAVLAVKCSIAILEYLEGQRFLEDEKGDEYDRFA